MELALAYFSLAVIVALYGRNSRIGFWGVLLFSVLLTPVLIFYGLLGLRPAKPQPTSTEQSQTKRWWSVKGAA
jgi:hypothetical protein